MTPRTPKSGPSAAWLLDRTEALCRADTTTGHEDRCLPALRALLEELGARVELQEVAPGRHNVLATWGAPQLLFSTHLDTVPPYLPPRREEGVLHGRGACDAKGQIAAQIGAIRELLARDRDDVAWLGVVGEETDSIGAEAAPAAFTERLAGCTGLINGEPTENVPASGQRGTQHVRLRTNGVAAHSGTPELGRSALWPLLDWLQRLRELPARTDPDFGDEQWSLGVLRGGTASNVIPAAAEALITARTLPGSTFLERVREFMPEEGEIAEVSGTEPTRFCRLQSFPCAPVTFGSDAPRLRRLLPGARLTMCGPGSITVAHTAREHIRGDELAAGCALLVRLAEAMLDAPPAAVSPRTPGPAQRH